MFGSIQRLENCSDWERFNEKKEQESWGFFFFLGIHGWEKKFNWTGELGVLGFVKSVARWNRLATTFVLFVGDAYWRWIIIVFGMWLFLGPNWFMWALSSIYWVWAWWVYIHLGFIWLGFTEGYLAYIYIFSYCSKPLFAWGRPQWAKCLSLLIFHFFNVKNFTLK